MTLYQEDGEFSLEGQTLHDCLWKVLLPMMSELAQKGFPVREVCHVIISVAISLENVILL